jgi:hypothetical protein
MKRILLATIFALAATPASAQLLPTPTRSVSLAGPRIGVTFLDDGVMERLAPRLPELRPTITQFGWQFEKQFFARDSGVTVLNEWVFLLGGLDQGVALPSASWLVGLRTVGGAEVGVGPNVTPLGVGLAIAAGTTFRAGAVNVPMNVAVVPSAAGTRVSVLTGFSLRRK